MLPFQSTAFVYREGQEAGQMLSRVVLLGIKISTNLGM